MYSSFQLAKKYLHYYRHAANGKGHGIHSPFVFDFVLNVCNNRNHYKAPEAIEALRRHLRCDRQTLPVHDLGAGSRRGQKQTTSVAHIARSALKPAKYAQLLFRLVRHYRPQNILELGTSLGITTAYLAAGNPNALVQTIEGNEAIAGKAKEGWAQLGIRNIDTYTGHFDAVLPQLLQHTASVDLAYIDGNHLYEPTLRYFEMLLPKTTDHSVLVFDDIHWSAEMEKAWAAIQNHPQVQYSIDLFFLGFVFFRKDFKVKQHFSIRF